MVEVHDERAIFISAKNFVEEAKAGVLFFAEDSPLAQTGVDQEPQSERDVGLAREITDNLIAALFRKGEILFFQGGNEAPLFVPDRGQNVDHPNVGGKRGFLFGRTFLRAGLREQGARRGQSGGQGKQERAPFDRAGAMRHVVELRERCGRIRAGYFALCSPRRIAAAMVAAFAAS